MYLDSLDKNISVMNPLSIYKRQTDYEEWKQNEVNELKSLFPMNAPYKHRNIQNYLTVHVAEARDLKSKSSEGSHTYLKLFYDGQVYTSPIYRDDLNPKYNFKVNL